MEVFNLFPEQVSLLRDRILLGKNPRLHPLEGELRAQPVKAARSAPGRDTALFEGSPLVPQRPPCLHERLVEGFRDFAEQFFLQTASLAFQGPDHHTDDKEDPDPIQRHCQDVQTDGAMDGQIMQGMDEYGQHKRHQGHGPALEPVPGQPGDSQTGPEHRRIESMVQPIEYALSKDRAVQPGEPPEQECPQVAQRVAGHREAEAHHRPIDHPIQDVVEFAPVPLSDIEDHGSFQGLLDERRHNAGAHGLDRLGAQQIRRKLKEETHAHRHKQRRYGPPQESACQQSCGLLLVPIGPIQGGHIDKAGEHPGQQARGHPPNHIR